MKTKSLLLLLLFVCACFSSSSCRSRKVVTVEKNRSLPPGQIKKITGERSAKRYAPGQQKKKRVRNRKGL